MSAREAHRCVAFFLLTLAVAFSCRCRRMAAQQPAALDSLGRRNSQIVRRENEKAIRQASAVDVVSSIGFKAKRSGDEILKASLVAQSEELVSYLRWTQKNSKDGISVPPSLESWMQERANN
eukprot:TRINITY_DN22277_c0_g1_i4.p1 TRINITY_DN22277_c0_g1~~TRINITY_DN22277_c0_g1_i4.p1  ORF type:complete len:132 (-),score=31.63 TRINITY_DN22277_c0_g1_i4:495-860(-)